MSAGMIPRFVLPGEIISVELQTGKLVSTIHHKNNAPSKNVAKCIFEHVYFSRPDSVVWVFWRMKLVMKWVKVLPCNPL